MYILKSSFVEKYKNEFNNAYNKYIEGLLSDDKKVVDFYEKHADIHLINPNRFNSNEFDKYDTYEYLKEQLTNRYKSIEYLSDGLFANENIKDEIYKRITGNDDAISVSLEKDSTIISLNINAQIVNKNLSLYTLNDKKIDRHSDFIVSLKNYRNVDTINNLNNIEDWTNNIVIKLEEDLMSDIDSLSTFEESTLKSEFGFTDDEVKEIIDATCVNSGLEECTDDNMAKIEKAKEIWSAKNTNNNIIKDFENECKNENNLGCDEAGKDKVVTIDMSRLDANTIEKFKPYIEKLVKANQILEELYKQDYREKLINKDYIENNCVIFSDEEINECYQETGSLCELLKNKSTSHFERMYIEEYQKFHGNTSSAPFKKGLFMALQCGVDGKWKLVGGNNAVQCKKRCSGKVEFHLNPEGYGNYNVDMYINNLRYQNSGQAQVAGVGVYCSRSNKDQSKHGEVYFSCGEKGKLNSKVNVWNPGYNYNYNSPNPGVRTTCRSYLLKFNGADGSFSYYRNAATGNVKRNNRGVIITCPNGSDKTIIHYVGKGHMCGLDIKENDDIPSEYPAYHNNDGTFECKPNLEHNRLLQYNCTGKFNKTAKISYDVEEI